MENNNKCIKSNIINQNKINKIMIKRQEKNYFYFQL